jgi:hypothetical protein
VHQPAGYSHKIALGGVICKLRLYQLRPVPGRLKTFLNLNLAPAKYW